MPGMRVHELAKEYGLSSKEMLTRLRDNGIAAKSHASILTDEDIEDILSRVDDLVAWVSDIKEYALQQAVSGKEWHGWKLVEGRSNRRYTNEAAVTQAVKEAGFDPFEHKLLGITAMQKLLGKSRFDELLTAYIEKPQGKPTLVRSSDKRPAMNTAKNDFLEDFDNE